MKIMWRRLFWTVALSCFVKSQSLPPLNGHSGEDTFADILSGVLQTSRAKDAFLILRGSLGERAGDILGKVSATTAARVPTLYVNADRTSPEFQVSSCAMSRDLVVYIYVAEREPDTVEGELMAEDIRRFIHNRVRPKVLVLMILRQPSRNLEALFRAIWSRKILDVIVVEYSASERSNEHSTIVHRYDPFTDIHSEEPYSASTAWFADEFPNMQSYPFVYAVIRRLPHTDVVPKPSGWKVKGVDKILNEILANKMNFTGVPKIMEKNTPLLKQLPNGTEIGVLRDVAAGKYDALLTTTPRMGHVIRIRPFQHYSYPLLIENWCFVVPRLVKRNFQSGIAIRLFFISFAIVGIFWLCSRLMRFDPGRWYPLKIVGVMLATSLPPAPTRLREQIIFLSVFVVSACYSSILFVELTSTNLISDRYARFDRLQDLIDSDLVLMVHHILLNITRQYNEIFEDHFRKAGKKIVPILHMDVCQEELLLHRNVSCLMEVSYARLTAVNSMQDGETTIQTTKLCYLSPPAAYVFPEESPYVDRVSELFLMLAEGGIRDKWYGEYLRNETKNTMNQHRTDFMYVSILHPLIYVLITGYSISTLVFVGELLWKYFDVNLNL